MNCIICGKEFHSRYGGKTCSRSHTAKYAALVRLGKVEASDTKFVRLESVAIRLEQEDARRKNLYLTSRITVSQETINSTNLQAMKRAA